MKRLLATLILFVLVGMAAQAQDLTETYTAPDGAFAFDYPAGWTLDDSRATIVLASPDSSLQIAILNPDAASRVGDKLTPVETLDLLLNFAQYPPSEITTVRVDSVEVARATYMQGSQREAVAAVVRYAASNTGVVVGVAPTGRLDEVEPTVMAVAASLRLADSPAEATTAVETTPAVEATEAAAEPLPEGVLFRDDFEGGLKTDWAASLGTPTIVQDGDNSVLQVNGDEAFYLDSGRDWTDYLVELRVKITQPTDIDGLIGVRFNPQDVTTYGAFFDTQDNSVGLAYFFGDNEYNILSSSRVNMAAGQWYNISLSVKGDMVELFFGSHRTNWLNSTQFDRGTFAVYASPDAQLYIDDIIIRDLRE